MAAGEHTSCFDPPTTALYAVAKLAARVAGCQAAMCGLLWGNQPRWAATGFEDTFAVLADSWPRHGSPLHQIRDGAWDGPAVQRTARLGWWTGDLAACRAQAPAEWADALAPFGSLAVLLGRWQERAMGWVVLADMRPQALDAQAVSLAEDLAQALALGGRDVMDLGRSEERYRTIAEVSNSLAYSFAVSLEGSLELDWATDSFEAVMGHPRSAAREPGGLAQMIHPDDLPKWRQRMEHLLAGDAQISALRIVRGDGETRWLRISARPERCPVTGRVHYINGAALDITNVRRMREELTASESTLRGIVENSRDGIILTDERGAVAVWNPAAAQITGLSASQALGRSVDDVYAQLSGGNGWLKPEAVSAFVEGALQTGDLSLEPKPTDLEILRTDGQLRTVQASMFTVHSDGGWRLGGQLRDVTERVALEREARRRASEYRRLQARTQTALENERARISRLIHDEVGQVLTALAFDVRWLLGRLRRASPEVRAKLDAMAVELGDTVKKVQQLATELYPTLLDHVGLCAAIEWQVKQFQERTAIVCEFSSEPPECHVERRRATAMYRILQEALTNIARHAQATHVQVSLVRQAHTLELTVRDNGRGITESEIRSPDAMGLMGMHERAERWGGTMRIYGVPDEGTEVRVTIPLGEEST